MHLQELPGWRTQERHHLGEVELVVQSVSAYSAEETTTFEEIPDLRSFSHFSRCFHQDRASTYHDSERPHVNFGIPVSSHDNLWCSVNSWHDVPRVLLTRLS